MFREHHSARIRAVTEPPINKRINAMTNINMGLEKTEGDILAFEVSDDTLEIAAGTAKEKANFTLGACLSVRVDRLNCT
jgi:hypothetical protein